MQRSHMQFTTSETENGDRYNRPAFEFMVIIPFLAIQLKATPNNNLTNDFYWMRKSSSLNVVQ